MFDPTPHYATNPSRVTFDDGKPAGEHKITVCTTICRINYPQLAEAKLRKLKAGEVRKPTEKPQFGCMLLLHKLDIASRAVDPSHNELVKAAFTLASEKFGNDWLARNANAPPSKRVNMPFRAQSELEFDYKGKGQAGMAQFDVGGSFLRAYTQISPALTNGRNAALRPDEVKAIKSGDYVIAEITLATYDTTENRGVKAYLRGIQYVAPGMPFVSETAKSGFGVLNIPAFDQAPAAGANASALFGA